MNNIETFFKGILIGAGMSIPGISGGTLAIILGLYNKLLYSVGKLLNEPRKNLFFLSVFSIGVCGGILATAQIISVVLSTPAGVPLRFAFLGAAAGCIPPILREAKFKPVTPTKLLYIVGGMVAAALIALIPHGVFDTSYNRFAGFFIRFAGGFITAIALVLPGISASQMLYMLGLYEQVIEQVSNLDILPLIPIIIGVVIGVFLTAKALSFLLEKYSGVYLVIFGFMIFSLKDLVPEWSSVHELIIGLVCAMIGFILAITISRHENKDALGKPKTSSQKFTI